MSHGRKLLGLIKASNRIKEVEGERGLTAGLNLPLYPPGPRQRLIYIALPVDQAVTALDRAAASITSTSGTSLCLPARVSARGRKRAQLWNILSCSSHVSALHKGADVKADPRWSLVWVQTGPRDRGRKKKKLFLKEMFFRWCFCILYTLIVLY